MSQAQATELAEQCCCQTEEQARMIKILYRRSGVSNRHIIVPYKTALAWRGDTSSQGELAVGGGGSSNGVAIDGGLGRSTLERMLDYEKYAGPLALNAASRALENSGVAPSEITHLVTVSCTGFCSPGVDIELISGLGLPATVERVHVGFMGCHGAINGMRTALALTTADPNARVLLTAVELCSLHYRFQWDPDRFLGNALFADGAAAIVGGPASSGDKLRSSSVARLNGAANGHAHAGANGHVATNGHAGSGHAENGHAQNGNVVNGQSATNGHAAANGHASHGDSDNDEPLRVLATGSCLLPNSRDGISWRVGDHGFEMMLSARVPDIIAANLRPWMEQWLGSQGLSLADVGSWAVHPGGPRILSAVEESLGGDRSLTAVSRDILNRYGNMSSPTVLFIVDQLRRMRAPRPYVALAFGPGLAAEAALLG
jgi:predicted naringenin-chalcone synthase